jgi:hypothetical protein
MCEPGICVLKWLNTLCKALLIALQHLCMIFTSRDRAQTWLASSSTR